MVDGYKDLCKEMIHILVVNLNNIEFTKNILEDLLKQTYPFQLTVIDNNSEEEGTNKLLVNYSNKFKNKSFLFLNDRVDLNRLWNEHYFSSQNKYLCFLNNDIRISRNFVEDTVSIFEKEPDVGCVVHTTNHPNYQSVTNLEYDIPYYKLIEGWDFTIRREAYSMIPRELKVFGGDDYLFNKLYDNNWKVAVALSSPVIHYKARSRRFFHGDRKEEVNNLRKYYSEKLDISSYSIHWPTFDKIIDKE